MGSYMLLDLAGGVAFLLWGAHGAVRDFACLRYGPGTALKTRLTAFLAGLGITALLQSSTATGFMTTTFVRERLVELVPAPAIMPGANVGTTLIVQIFSFIISWLAARCKSA